jgi:hypothetical protein
MSKIMLAAAVAVCGVVFGVGLAAADPGNGSGASVTRVNPNTCQLVMGGNLVQFPCSYQRVETKSGNIQYNVKGTVDPSVFSTDKPIHIDNAGQSPLYCAVDAVNFWNGVITPSGNINFSCANTA